MNATYSPQAAEPSYIINEISTSDLAKAWADSLDLKARTREAYSKNLSYYLDWLQIAGRKGTSRADVLAYKDFVSSRYEASTVSAYLTAVRVFYTWASIEYGVPNIAANIKGAKKPSGFRKDPLSVDQVRAVLSGIDTSSLEGLRDLALLSLMAYTGIRVIEAQRSDIKDIRQSMGRSVLYIQGKGRDEKDEFVVLSSKVLAALSEYIAARGEDLDSEAPLFVSASDRNGGQRLTTRSVSRIVKSRFEAAGVSSSRLTAHSLRHTAVTLALVGGATVQQAQGMARHSNVNTTMIYAHNLERMEHPAEDFVSSLLDRWSYEEVRDVIGGEHRRGENMRQDNRREHEDDSRMHAERRSGQDHHRPGAGPGSGEERVQDPIDRPGRTTGGLVFGDGSQYLRPYLV